MKILLLLTFIFLCFSQHFIHEQGPIIQKVNSLQKQWQAGHNNYFDFKTLQQIKSILGTITSTPQNIKLPIRQVEPLVVIPSEFFSSSQWPNCQSIKQIRDQSMCGSCWAFAAVQVLTDRICIESNQSLQVRISAQDLLTCCKDSCGKGCNGGYPPAAWTWFKNVGVVTGWLYNTTGYCQPYSLPPCNHQSGGHYPPCGNYSGTPNCSYECTNGANYLSDKWFAKTIYGVGSMPSKIQTQIMTKGPVQAMFTVYSDFLSYKSGVYHHVTGQELGGHSVKIVGWGVQNKVPYWLVANSWNQDWGDNGFFKIKRGDDQCGIEGQVVAGIPKLKDGFKTEQEIQKSLEKSIKVAAQFPNDLTEQ